MNLLQEIYKPNDQVIVAPVLLGAPFSQHALPVATEPRHVIRPNTTPGIHFHEVDHVATVQGVVIGTDAGTPNSEARKAARELNVIDPPEHAMLVAGAQWKVVAEEGTVAMSTIHAPATAQEGEAKSLITYVRAANRLPEGTVVWMTPDSQSAVAALRSYANNPRAKGMMTQIYAQDLDYGPREVQVALNVLATPSHRFTMVNAWADYATKLKPRIDGSRTFRRCFHFVPPEPYKQQYQLGPRGVRQYLTKKAGEELTRANRQEFGDAWQSGRGLRIEWFEAKQERHIQRQRMACIATM